MRTSTIKLIFSAWLLINLSIVAADENAQQQLKLDTIVKLLNSSSVSENILSSNSEVAVQYYNLAKAAHKHAVIAFKEGDIEKSNLFIKKATDALSDATMFANMNKGTTNVDADRHKYDETRESVEALMKAVHRVAEEKGANEDNKEMLEQVNELNKQAKKYAADEMYVEASRKLELILSLVRTNIVNLKMGDTLVRTLTFANPKEEFRYEIDRNDAHFLLMKTFFSERPSSADDNEKFSGEIKTARQLRQKAEDYANSKEYKHAIKALEESSNILIGIIRMAGTKIPG